MKGWSTKCLVAFVELLLGIHENIDDKTDQIDRQPVMHLCQDDKLSKEATSSYLVD